MIIGRIISSKFNNIWIKLFILYSLPAWINLSNYTSTTTLFEKTHGRTINTIQCFYLLNLNQKWAFKWTKEFFKIDLFLWPSRMASVSCSHFHCSISNLLACLLTFPIFFINSAKKASFSVSNAEIKKQTSKSPPYCWYPFFLTFINYLFVSTHGIIHRFSCFLHVQVGVERTPLESRKLNMKNFIRQNAET